MANCESLTLMLDGIHTRLDVSQDADNDELAVEIELMSCILAEKPVFPFTLLVHGGHYHLPTNPYFEE